jgi:hypothetical protein
VAVIVQIPTPTPATKEPVKVQTEEGLLLLKLTGKPEVAVALTVPVPPT